MNDEEWERAVATLSHAANEIEILSRCLAVRHQLEAWRAIGTEAAGADAADALDQARGLLEELAAGRAQELLAQVEAVALDLPTPLE